MAFEGLEVPLLVLQTKVFLIVLLRKYSPFVFKRQTIIRRVQSAIHSSFRRMRLPGKTNQSPAGLDIESCATSGDDVASSPRARVSHRSEELLGMKLFTPIPFPEPKRVIHIRPREHDELISASTPPSIPHKSSNFIVSNSSAF